jgi:YVTN family beta-propeller protein
MQITRRNLISAAAGLAVLAPARLAWAQAAIIGSDRVFICNEDSNTLTVINPATNTVSATINLTSFDEDPRPPFRYVTGGVVPAHVAMVRKPLYHGAIDVHGAAPSPDNRLIATTGRGTSNVYLIDTATLKVIGNTPNPQAGSSTNPERLTSGIIVGREPHEPTFTRNGKELWVTIRGEDRIAIIDVGLARRGDEREHSRAVRSYLPTINGPAQVWFSKDGQLAFVVSQKVAAIDVFATNFDANGASRPQRVKTIDIRSQDPRAFTPFLKTTPDGQEAWLSHKLADAVSAWSMGSEPAVLDTVALGENARPNHVEFVENARGKAVYVSASLASTTAGRAMLRPVVWRSSTGRPRRAAARSSVMSSAKAARRTAYGPILTAPGFTSRTSRTSCPIRRTRVRPCARFSMLPIRSVPS